MHALMHQFKRHLELQVWQLQYALAESRDAHIAFGRHVRAAACCLALAIARLME